MKKYWYYIMFEECPVCGRIRQYRERRYSPKPVNGEDRVKYDQQYDWCEE